MSKTIKPQVFISYADEDIDIVRQLYTDLKNQNINVWLDRENLKSGKWKPQIGKAISKSRYFLFCMSSSSLKKISDGSGFVDDELQTAFEIALAQDEKLFTILPIRIQNVDRGDNRLSMFQQFDLFDNWDIGIRNLLHQLDGNPLSVIGINPSNISLTLQNVIVGLHGKAEALFNSRKYESALQDYKFLEKLGAHTAISWNTMGCAFMRLDKNDEALRTFKKSIKLDCTNAYAFYNKGYILYNDYQQYEEALTCFKQATNLSPRYLLAWWHQGSILFDLKRWEEAILAYDNAIEIDFELAKKERSFPDPFLFMAKGYTLLECERFNEALIWFDKALDCVPGITIALSDAWRGKLKALENMGVENAATREARWRVKCADEWSTHTHLSDPDFGEN